MNKILLCLTILSFLFIKTKNVIAQSSSEYLNKSSLLTDVNYMLQNFEDIQVNCYLHISKESLHIKKDSIFKTLPDNVPLKKAFITVNQIAAFLKDTHTYVDNDDRIFKEYKQVKLFPIKLQIDESKNISVGQKFVSEGNLTAGQTIIDINGIPLTDLFQKSIDMQGGLLNYQTNEAINYFSYNLFLLNVTAPYIISYRRTTVSKILYDTIPGITFSEYQKASQMKPTTKYSYKLLQDNIGYIDFRSMSGGIKHFKQFLDSCFSNLKSTRAKGLIVDLRYNGGGNSEFGELLLSYLTSRSYRLSSGRRFKVSQQYQQFMRQNYPDQSSKEVKDYLNSRPGTILSIKYEKKKYLIHNPNRYNLKTCFLIGPQNLSSATMLADGAQTYRIATLIGQPTGAPANDGGESYNFKLPYSKFKISTSSAFDVRANGKKKDMNPILPDIYINEYKVDQVDAILNAGLIWINK